MSEDRSSTESSPQSAELPDFAANGSGTAPRGKSHQAATPTKSAPTEKSEDPATVNGFHSVPMTATTSSSSEVGFDVSAAGPYGTRSRGRNGAPRPNYAEDRDIDMDFELTSPAPLSSKASGSSGRRSAAQQNSSSVNGSPAAEDKGPAASTRRGQAAVNGVHANAGAKDAIPGTSTFSTSSGAGTGTSGTRKRKQPLSGAGSTTANSNGITKRALATGSGGAHEHRYSNMMTFENSGARLKNGQLKADDGTVLRLNDHVYLICEPPGEPYYLGRIMEFLPAKENPSGPVEMIRINWYYRPKDIHRRVPDTRLLFASMHSDPCPLSSLRGKCTISHISEIRNLDEYRKQKDTFWYDKMFDRYMLRYYEVVPTKDVINVPENVKKVLDERWKFVLCELARRKELTGAVKTCKRCALYAASAESVDCAVCHSTYHMSCVRPVLTKKPARGFAWACAACSRAQERKLEARNTPIIGATVADVEEEIPEEEEEDPATLTLITGRSTPATEAKDIHPRPATAAQIAQAKVWPYRYFGIHCQLEDALDYDDRIYPRASSRIGTRHQAVVIPWYGHPIEYAKPLDLKKKAKSGKAAYSKLSKETLAAIEADKQERLTRPKWVVDEPVGYVRRGEDEPVPVNGKQVRTAELLFKMPEANQIPSTRGEDDAPGSELSREEREKFIDEYMDRARKIAPEKGLPEYSTNFLDKALEYLYSESFNVEAALARLKRVDIYKDLQEPKLSTEQIKLFEEGVAKYGSELLNVRRHVGSIEHRHIVRYYYMWKKTPKGRQIWGNYESRRGKKEAKRDDPSSKLLDDVADDHDDSAFDNDKAVEKKRGFQCKFCATRSSPQWRRAPLYTPGTALPADPSSKKGEKSAQLTAALCHRCAILWRKYAIEWKDADDLAKKLAAGGNKAWRRKLDEEMLAQILVSDETPLNITSSTAATAASLGLNVNSSLGTDTPPEPAKKKARTMAEKESTATSARTSVEPPPKKKTVEKPAEPQPIVPDPPRAKTLPCAVCAKIEPTGDEHVSCRDCRLTVHRQCYGINPERNCTKWLCDMCLNDRSPIISTQYECVLCPVTWTEHELMEAPRSNHKKKTERDREKERLEKEMVAEAIKLYQQRQQAVGKPIGPREPLKRTVGNNWVHVTCAMWNPEIKFGTSKDLEPAEGFGLIPAERYRESCKICKKDKGACVPCHFPGCNAKFHVGCAFQAEYIFGFDVTPVKSSRRDSISTIRMGEEAGSVTAGIWCPTHTVQTIVHEMSETTDHDGLNALQLFARTYKQADLTLTGTVRKAAHVQQAVGASIQSNAVGRRASAVNGASISHSKDELKAAGPSTEDNGDEPATTPIVTGETSHSPTASQTGKVCARCSSSVSPRWWPVENGLRPGLGTNGLSRLTNGSPFHIRTQSQSSVSNMNGDRHPEIGQAREAVECHKCHIKKPALQTSPEPHLSPYSAPRAPLLPTAPSAEYGPPCGPHGHPAPPGVPSRPAPSHGGPEWYPGYEQRSSSGAEPGLRPWDGPKAPDHNSYASTYPSAMNGWSAAPPTHVHPHGHPHGPPHPPPAPAHYAGGPPLPPHTFAGRPPLYGPVPLHSPHAAPARTFGPSMSPPDRHASIARHSPQHSLSGIPPPAARVYTTDRVLDTHNGSPSIPRGSVDPMLPNTPGKADDLGASATRPTSSGRYAGPNGTGAVSGASASPSLKNLLS